MTFCQPTESSTPCIRCILSTKSSIQGAPSWQIGDAAVRWTVDPPSELAQRREELCVAEVRVAWDMVCSETSGGES